MVGLVSMSANAATVFAPTDGDVNFLFGDLNGGTLSMFDDEDTGYTGTLLAGTRLTIPVPSIVGIAGPVNANNDFIATNANSNTLTLTGSDNFILGLRVGGIWYSDTSVDSVGANSYHVTFGDVSGSNLYEVDVTIMPTVPVPAAFWLFGSGLIGLVAVYRRKG
jgi:hypothetical protein